jgi:MFS family permease
MMEAGLFPGLAAQLCSWYRSDEMSKPIMWMFGWQNCAGIFGSLIAYGISYMNGLAGLSAWRWVYLLEGLATVLLGVVVWFVLPDYPKSPRSAAWLSQREQEYLEARLIHVQSASAKPWRLWSVMVAAHDHYKSWLCWASSKPAA